jgi:hypothetical protein
MGLHISQFGLLNCFDYNLRCADGSKASCAAQQHLLRMPLYLQVIWLFLLAIPVACVAWTITHEEIFREPREYCITQSENNPHFILRKCFFVFTCEYCFSHYVVIIFLIITRYKLLFDDWRGYLIGGLALVWVANQYMSLYAHLRLDIHKERVEIKHVEQKVQTASAEQTEQQEESRAA